MTFPIDQVRDLFGKNAVGGSEENGNFGGNAVTDALLPYSHCHLSFFYHIEIFKGVPREEKNSANFFSTI